MNSICRTPGSSRPTQLTTEMERIIEEQMQADDETTAIKLLQDQQSCISKSTVLQCRTSLG